MSELFEKLVSSEKLYNGKVLSMRKDIVSLPNGKEASREVVEHNGAVGVVAVTENNEVVLVKQFRAGIRKVTLELPAGKLEIGEDPLECGKRELQEETGFIAKSFNKLTQIATSPAILEEIIYIYLAQDLSLGNTNPDEDEFVETIICSFDEAKQKIINNEIIDAKTITGILLADIILNEKR